MEKSLNEYENQQVELIKEWKAEEPSVISKSLGVMLSPATWLINKIIPEVAIRGALDFSSATAEFLTDTNDIKRDAYYVSRITHYALHCYYGNKNYYAPGGARSYRRNGVKLAEK